MLGVWFLADSVGNKVAGLAAGFISSAPMPLLFGVIGGVCLAASVIAFLLIKPGARADGRRALNRGWTGGPDSKPTERRGPESNRRIAVLQTAALPLGYRAAVTAKPRRSGLQK